MYELSDKAWQGAKLALGNDDAHIWRENLPAKVLNLQQVWGIRPIRSLKAGTRGLILLCKSRRGKVVIKIPYDPQEVTSEYHALMAWKKVGAKHIVRPYKYLDGILSTYYVKSTVVDKYNTDIDFHVMCQVLQSLHKKAPRNCLLPTLFDDISQRLDKAEDRLKHIESHLSYKDIDDARDQLEQLEQNTPHLLVHADCHAGNILRGKKSIRLRDPKGAIGDPNYDCAMWALKADMSKHTEQWITEFSYAGYNSERIRMWLPIIALHECVAYLHHGKSLERLPIFYRYIDQLKN